MIPLEKLKPELLSPVVLPGRALPISPLLVHLGAFSLSEVTALKI